MITCELMGGLGNQLFQIATTTALALRNNDTACFNIDDHKIGLQGRDAINYKENIFRNLLNQKIDSVNVFEQNGFHYENIPYSKNLKLIGYFQSEKYFIDYRDELLELFKPTKEIDDYIEQKYGKILNRKTCSLHVRHGDYLQLSNHHPPCSIQYYIESIKKFDNNTLFIVFSDDISWCKSVFKGDNFFFIEGEEDYIDLYIMSKCLDNIIANSSFSWWGSWLNPNKNKKIISPLKWFGVFDIKDQKDIIPNNWIKI